MLQRAKIQMCSRKEQTNSWMIGPSGAIQYKGRDNFILLRKSSDHWWLGEDTYE